MFQLIMKDETNEKRKMMLSWTAKDDFPSWIPMEGRARRSWNLLPFLDTTNGRARRSWKSTKFTCLSPFWMPRMAGPERYSNHPLVWIRFKQFLIQLDPWSVGPGTNPTASYCPARPYFPLSTRSASPLCSSPYSLPSLPLLLSPASSLPVKVFAQRGSAQSRSTLRSSHPKGSLAANAVSFSRWRRLWSSAVFMRLSCVPPTALVSTMSLDAVDHLHTFDGCLDRWLRNYIVPWPHISPLIVTLSPLSLHSPTSLSSLIWTCRRLDFSFTTQKKEEQRSDQPVAYCPARPPMLFSSSHSLPGFYLLHSMIPPWFRSSIFSEQHRIDQPVAYCPACLPVPPLSSSLIFFPTSILSYFNLDWNVKLTHLRFCSVYLGLAKRRQHRKAQIAAKAKPIRAMTAVLF